MTRVAIRLGLVAAVLFVLRVASVFMSWLLLSWALVRTYVGPKIRSRPIPLAR